MRTHFKRAIYPGTFDPVTRGHLDILERASAIFDEVIIAVAVDSSKSTLFPLQQRLEFLQQSIKQQRFHCPIRVTSFRGLLVEFAQQSKAQAVVRGLRAVSDFEYEFQMALMNRHQAPKVETVYLMPHEKYVYLSSSIVREVSRLGGDLAAFLPPPVLKALKQKFSKTSVSKP